MLSRSGRIIEYYDPEFNKRAADTSRNNSWKTYHSRRRNYRNRRNPK